MLNNNCVLSIPYQIFPCGDHAVTVSFGNSIDKNVHQTVMALFHKLQTKKIAGVKDIIPAYCTVTIVYDMLFLKSSAHTAYANICKEIEACLQQLNENTFEEGNIIEVPVCYDEGFGADLENIAAKKQLSIEEIIGIHTSVVYDVYMLGFLPGFAYMGVVDDKIATPRLVKPRTKVDAGSVGIAGNQTGIYPLDSPGGWNIIGRTPLKLFDAGKENPCLFKPGDRVKFVRISIQQFEQIKQSA